MTNMHQLLEQHPHFKGQLPCDPNRFNELEKHSGIVLPQDHRAFLEATNGCTLWNGYERVFGLRSSKITDAIAWNDLDCWKFAWPNVGDQYWCFAESAWGDQFAYYVPELREAKQPSVYWLDADEMHSQICASSFLQFIENIIRVMKYDWFQLQLHNKFGPLPFDKHLIYSPPLGMLPEGGMYEEDYVTVMPARAAMICNGDIYSQFTNAKADAVALGLETWEDEKSRLRLRIIWQN